MPSPITSSSSIDVQGMVAALMKAESKPLTQMQTEAKKIDTKISAYGKLQGSISSFRDAAATLSRLETWRAVKASSGNSAAVEITAGAGASATQRAIEVQQLAQSQTVTSGAIAGSDTVIGGGTLRIQLGTQPSGATSFTADATRPEVSVTVAAGATLADVRDAINGADAGVRASIVRDGDQYRLFLSSTTSGGNQAFRMRVDDLDGGSTDASGLSQFAFDPTAAAGAGRNLSLVRQATDAQYSIDGVALTARSNRIAAAMDGVDLVLKQVTTAPVLLDVTVDTDALQKSMQTFVEAYNSMNKLLAEQTKYDEASKTAGALQGDRSAVGILSQVRSIVRETVTGGSLTKLADLGVSLQRDGSLQLKTATFQSAATDTGQLERALAGVGSGAGATDVGLMLRFRDLGDRLIGSNGTVKTAADAWQTRLAANKQRQSAFENRMTDMEKRLLRQYSSLDAQLSAAQQSSNALASSLAGLAKLR